MKSIAFLFVMLMLPISSDGQKLQVNGTVTSKRMPLPGTLVLVFKDGTFCKKLISDGQGQFTFSGGNHMYFMLFFKPGMEPESMDLNIAGKSAPPEERPYEVTYSFVIHVKDKTVQKIPVAMDMHEMLGPADSVMFRPRLLGDIRPEMAEKYISLIYKYASLFRSGTRDSTARIIRDNSIRQAIIERDRFAHFSQDSAADVQKNRIVTTVIGPDTYEMQVNPAGQKRWFKNTKPVTETTYRFETTRRYEGILKNTKDVKRFERYHPEEHVK